MSLSFPIHNELNPVSRYLHEKPTSIIERYVFYVWNSRKRHWCCWSVHRANKGISSFWIKKTCSMLIFFFRKTGLEDNIALHGAVAGLWNAAYALGWVCRTMSFWCRHHYVNEIEKWFQVLFVLMKYGPVVWQGWPQCHAQHTCFVMISSARQNGVVV